MIVVRSDAPQSLWRTGWVVAICGTLVLLCLWAVSDDLIGFGPRRVVRTNPLKNSLRVVSIQGEVLTLADGRRVRTAGATLNRTGSTVDPSADSFLKLLIDCGVEIEWIGNPDSSGVSPAVLRCEIPFHHWCGNDPVSKHYEQGCLNEVLLVGKYASVIQADVISMPPAFRNRCVSAVTRAQERWRDDPFPIDFSNWGVNINESYYLNYR